MSLRVEQLGSAEADPIRSFLAREPLKNLHLLAVLEERARVEVHAAFAADQIAALALVDPERGLVLPSAIGSASDFSAIGEHLASRVRLRKSVGERSAVEALVKALGKTELRTSHLHRLYWVSPDQLGPYLQPGLRVATESDLPRLLALAERALTESLGSAPTAPELSILERETLENVRLQQSRVFEVEGQLVLKVEVSFRFSMGAELGGLYIAPEYRRRGYATHALGHLSRQLLASLPLLTMRAADALAGVARKVGYQSGPAMQLLVTDRK
jgi:GNAT superfamily N-acetyltransferase